MTITSPAFDNLGPIPPVYTCDGDGINPPLEISGVPEGAESIALIVDDPDAVNGVFDHWLLWNINPKITDISEDSVPEGAVSGINSSGTTGFIPPCPPMGIHNYRFILMALNKKLDLPTGATRDELEEVLEGVVIERAELVGTYGSEDEAEQTVLPDENSE